MKRLHLILLSILILVSCDRAGKDRIPQVEDLLKKMTLEEKIGQMTQICFSTITLDGTKTLHMDTAKVREAITEYHIGSFLSGTGSGKEWVDFVTEVQRIAMKETRLGIPVILGIDHVHGANYVDEGTILPHNLTLSCSFDSALAGLAAEVTADETAVTGLVWSFSPVLDIGKNPYWPRFYETFGEDPLVCSRMGLSYLKHYDRSPSDSLYGLVSCGKHFVGYSDPKTGWDRTPAEIPEQILWEFFIPPFSDAINEGIKTIMVNSGEVNGQPVHTSEWLLQEILRSRLGFEGVILTDIKDIQKIVEMHAAAKDLKEATFLALEAGIDISMSCDAYDFCRIVQELVEEGRISEKRIEESTRRILNLKYELGLFENPYPPQNSLDILGCKEHRQAAEKIAEESMVLLKNNGILPLRDPGTRIFLSGFAINSRRMLNGAWTHEWMGAAEERHAKHMPTLVEAMMEEFGKEQITNLETPVAVDEVAKKQFRQMAGDADVIVLTVGEEPYSEFKGNIGDLSLDEGQKELVRLAGSTNKPVILILIEGRPRSINGMVDQSDAVVFAGIPGSGGGPALAGILSGRVNPSGKLSFSYPGQVGHYGPYYHKPSDRYISIFPFGHGLSYTNFEYSDLSVSDSIFKDPDREITLSVRILNTGSVKGKEAVLVYFRDNVGRLTRPVKQLLDFRKTELLPGEDKTLEFSFRPYNAFSYPDRKGNKILEQGSFTIMIDSLEVPLHFKQDIN